MADPNVAAQPQDGSVWRANMPRTDRVQICQHIMHKLGALYQSVSETVLKERTRQFEAHAYTYAVSRRDYLEKIAEGLSSVESQAQQQE